jgi:toxin ParE1/3/4
MKAKPIVPRELANQDVDEALQHYLSANAEQAALGFIDALEQAYAHIGRHPATGSPRYAHALNLSGLRSWSLTRYPHLVFYIGAKITLMSGAFCMENVTFQHG